MLADRDRQMATLRVVLGFRRIGAARGRRKTEAFVA